MLVLRTANGSSVESADIIGLAALKLPTDVCLWVLAVARSEDIKGFEVQ